MKYIILNDISFVIKKNKKILFLYFLAILSPILIKFFSFTKITVEDYYLSLGLKINKDMVSYIAYFMNILFCLYISFKIFSKNFKENVCNTFMRMSCIKWCILKMISISFIIICIRLFMHIIIGLILISLNIHITDFFNIMLKDILFNIVISYFMIFCYIISNLKFGILYIIIMLFFLLLNFPIDIVSINNYCYLIYIYILLFSLCLLFFYKLYCNIFERSQL